MIVPEKPPDLRICRLARIYPRAVLPGDGLVAYYTSARLPYPCLYVAQELGEPTVPFPPHVQLLRLRYPEPLMPTHYDINRLHMLLLYVKKGYGNVVLTLKALPHIWRFKPDLTHMHTPLTIGLGVLTKLSCRCSLVLTFHGTDYYRFQRSRGLQWLVKRFVDHVTCIAPNMLEDFRTLIPQIPATYTPNGVDVELFSDKGSEPRRKQIVFSGRLAWQKSLPDLIQAAAQVFRTLPDYRLVLVGDGPLRDELQQVTQRAGIADRVDFLGMVPQTDLVRVLRESELFVMSSISEGFPKALIEAMACGLPTVVTDVGACKLIASQSGIVVPPHQPEQLAEAMLTLLQDNERRQHCARQARQDAEQYSWQACADRMDAVYRQVVNHHTP